MQSLQVAEDNSTSFTDQCLSLFSLAGHKRIRSIFELPLDIFDDILTRALNIRIHPRFCVGWFVDYDTCQALSSTCTQFHYLVQPIICQRVLLNWHFDTVPLGDRALIYLDTWRTNPNVRPWSDRGDYIGGLSGKKTKNYSAFSLIWFLVNLKYVEVYDTYGSPLAWMAVYKAMQCLPNIKKISLCEEFQGDEIYEGFYLSQLRYLKSKVLGTEGSVSLTTGSVLKCQCKRNKHDDSIPFLEINSFPGTAKPEYLEEFFTWHTTFDSILWHHVRSPIPYVFNFPAMMSILRPLRHSLMSIKLDPVAEPYNQVARGFLNLTCFPNLERLELPVRDLPLDGRAAAYGLLGPKLTHLVLDFTDGLPAWQRAKVSGERVRLSRAGAYLRAARWLKEITLYAIRKRSSLRHVEIRHWCSSAFKDQRLVYPWDVLEDVREFIEPRGISLIYDEPWISRQWWEQEYSDIDVGLVNTLSGLGAGSLFHRWYSKKLRARWDKCKNRMKESSGLAWAIA